MRSIFAFLMGSLTTALVGLAVFFHTTVSYRSTLFPGQTIKIQKLKAVRS